MPMVLIQRRAVRALCVLFLLSSPRLHAAPITESLDELRDREERVVEVVRKALPATVAVTDGNGWGSGVIVSGEGLVLTAGHVIMLRRRFRLVLSDGRAVTAVALGRNMNNDAGMLRIVSPRTEPWPHVDLGQASDLDRGDWCVALGHPGGLEEARSAPVRAGRILSIGTRTMVTDSTIVVGDSGGPMFDLDGKLIAIHSMIGGRITNNRHTTIDMFRRDWDRLKDGETWGELGNFDTALAASRFFGTRLEWREFVPRVTEVVGQSPAAEAGLRVGDVLTSVAGQTFADPLELSLVLGEHSPGERIPTVVRRRQNEVELTVELGNWPPKDAGDGDAPFKVFVGRPGKHEKASPLALAMYRPVVAPTSGCTVTILNGSKQVALGTVVRSDGFIVTKLSEIRDISKPSVRLGDRSRLEARLVGEDKAFDIALLKVRAADLKPVVWSDEEPEPGRLLITPDTRGRPLASGVLSVASRSLKSAERAFLGIKAAPARRGIIIDTIIEDSAAERAGLNRGDRVLRIDKRAVTSPTDIVRRIGTYKPGDRIRVEFERNNVLQELTAVLSSRFINGDWLLNFQEMNLTGTPLSEHSNGFPVVLQHDTVLLPEQCGGPLLDLDGEAIGLNIARAGRVTSYAIPAARAKTLIDRLIEEAPAKAE